MNCKQGDLAVIVRSSIDNQGVIVRVLRFYGSTEFHDGPAFSDCWLVEGNVKFKEGRTVDHWSRGQGADACIPDSCLRPLRDNDGDDETLSWAGLPQEVPA